MSSLIFIKKRVVIYYQSFTAKVVSNYLLAFGKTKIIKKIHDVFLLNSEDSSEISITKVSKVFSMLVVSKSHVLTNSNGSTFFFKGWFQDHQNKSVVLGGKGFKSWIENEEHESLILDTDFEGSYVSAVFGKGEFVVRNDTFSYMPVIHFSTKDLFVCSDSMFIISELRKALEMPCKLNKKVMHSRAWMNGLACAVMSNDTQIQDVKILSPGKHIEIKMKTSIFSSEIVLDIKNIVKSSNLNQAFAVKFDSYELAIRDAATRMAQSTLSLLDIDDVMIKFGLSGGLDSRVILASVLQKPELLEHISISTNTHPSRKDDFEVVDKLSKLFSFEFNDAEKIRSQKKKHSLKLEKVADRFALWVLSCMGLFDMMYLHDSYWPEPHIIDLGGHGAESIKGTFSSMKFEHYIKPKKISNKAKFSRKGFRYMSEAKSANNVHEAIRSELSNALATSGIDLDGEAPIQWHYLCYKSPIVNGRFLDCSAIGIRPFIQHSLFALSISDINPFKHVKKGDPTMLHDMLVLLNPELAAIDFENEKSNISEEYIQSRLEALGGRLQLSESEPYTIYGSIREMKNGPPNAFLKMVKHDFQTKENDIDSILGALERSWEKITDKEVKSAYQNAYDTAKEKLSDPDYYLPEAGTPAAKIISLSLLDSK